MSLIFATQLTAVATTVLAAFAIITAWYARRAFLKQSQEVSAIERQVKDQQELTRQQAELLEVQSRQLEIQRQQFADQRKANARQAKVLELQAAELQASLIEYEHEEQQRRRAQASRVFVRQERHNGTKVGKEKALPYITATVQNDSDQPVYDVTLRWRRSSAKHDDPNQEALGVIMPGDRVSGRREFQSDAEMDATGAIVAFRDASRVVWICRPDGTLRDEDAERRATASRPRKAVTRLTREVHDLVADLLAQEPIAPPSGLTPSDKPEAE